MHSIQDTTFSEAYPRLIHEILRNGREVAPTSGNPTASATKEVAPISITIADPTQHLVSAYNRPINVAFALAEVLWILQGRNDVGMLKFYNSNIAQFSDDGKTFNAAYGHRLRHAHGFDQVWDVVRTLRRDPNSRQAIINIWHPEHDRGWEPDNSPEGGLPRRTKDRACNLISQPMIRDGKLQWLQIQRSNDAIWGTPYNWMQFSHLQRWIAHQLEVPVGPFHHVVHSMHIYDRHWDEAKYIGLSGIENELSPLPAWKESTREFFDSLAVYEQEIRRGGRHLYPVDVNDDYWTGVLRCLTAHACYKQHEDHRALEFLMFSATETYAAAQIHFYLHNRWHKPKYKDIRIRIDHHYRGKPYVLGWFGSTLI